jgi:2-oxo-4-hydroxy-4-carboxy-5-ureidoimidazoline decarboxylase
MDAATELSALDQAAFVQAMEGIWEHSPWVAAQAWAARPFANIAELHAAMVSVVATASTEDQLALIRAHPELAGRAAQSGELTRHSESEQGRAGLNACSPEELAQLTTLNRLYQEKFGFPFVLAVAPHTRANIIRIFADRLHNDIPTEKAECLRQIGLIAWFRLQQKGK